MRPPAVKEQAKVSLGMRLVRTCITTYLTKSPYQGAGHMFSYWLS